MKRSEFICHLIGVEDNDKVLNLLENEFGATIFAEDIGEMLTAYNMNQGEYDSRNYLIRTLFDDLICSDFIYRVSKAKGTSEYTAFQDYSEDFDYLANGELVTFVYRGYKFESNKELDQLIDDFANGKI